jgi:hypothetical protein
MTGHQRTGDPPGAVPLGPANNQVDFFTHAACAQARVDPSIFTSEEDDQQAVMAARAVCLSCPVQLPCRRYAYHANPYGVYAGETQSERTANLKLHGSLPAAEHLPHGEEVVA